MGSGTKFGQAVVVTSDVVQVGLVIAIVSITAVHLQELDFTSSAWEEYDFFGECVWQSNSDSVCTYTYVAAGASLIASLSSALFQCITCNLCGLGNVIDVILGCFGIVWWTIFSIVMTTYNSQANEANRPEQNWRTSIVVMGWFCVGAFSLLLIGGFGLLVNCLCGRFSRDRKNDDVKIPGAAGPAPPQVVVVNNTVPPPAPVPVPPPAPVPSQQHAPVSYASAPGPAPEYGSAPPPAPLAYGNPAYDPQPAGYNAQQPYQPSAYPAPPAGYPGAAPGYPQQSHPSPQAAKPTEGGAYPSVTY